MSGIAVADAKDQADLSLVAALDWDAHVLPSLPWRRPTDAHGQLIGEHPGVVEWAERRHLDTTGLLNDLAQASIMADVRLHPDTFAELLRDPHRPTRGLRVVNNAQGVPIGFEIQGPGKGEWRANNTVARGYRPGTHWWRFTTEEWTEVPAFVAHWFWWAQREEPRLGAAYRRSLAAHERDPDQGRDATAGVPGVVQRMALAWEAGESEIAPAELFVVRMECERAPGERPSGLIDPREHENAAQLLAAQAQIAALQRQIDKLNKKPGAGQEG